MNANNTSRSKYKCGICGQPKKGHICQAQGSSSTTQGDEDVSHERQRLLEKLQNRLGNQGAASNDSPSPPNSGNSSQSASQRPYQVTIDIPAAPPSASAAEGGGGGGGGGHEHGHTADNRPMSMDLGRPVSTNSIMSMDMTPISPGLWTPSTSEMPLWTNNSPGTAMSQPAMWAAVPPSSPGISANMWVLPPSPSATLKAGSPSATAPVPVWSQAPPTTASTTTPGWGLSSTPWGLSSTPGGTSQTPFWHHTPSGGVGTAAMWPE